MTNKQVAEAFANNRSGKSNSMYSEGNVVFSYGSHFPIAARTEAGIVYNKSKYSNTTSRHQFHVRQALQEAGLTIAKELTTPEIRALV